MKVRLGKRRRLPVPVYLILLFVACFSVFEAYRWVMPFVARNPLYHEVTIGESVINSWRYGGEDEEGYLRFYDTSSGQTAVLPPTSKLFGADGQFVVLESASPGSLTFAEPLESAPPIWYAIMLLFAGLSLWLIMYRMKVGRKKRMHMRKQSPASSILSGLGKTSQTRRFRPAKKQRPRFFR
ncbi:hypothetical protein [Alicyclobacillus dauci]|uniref:DUF3592 domain-containing protein n=1 Tax=Alicyclobacillus dauci TaxID=1475485 RepID=A0ABY6Z133_9BACL|nr:hypothetical protein [Alicyclobacillus dauci]WAH36593.1 hypothetical protein NZD86_20695 [Alicyclobacillus dauci]